jgi:hypothetical protein
MFSSPSTIQTKEVLRFDGETYGIFDTPLEPWIAEHPEKRDEFFTVMRTACWRGYVGSWRIV